MSSSSSILLKWSLNNWITDFGWEIQNMNLLNKSILAFLMKVLSGSIEI